MLYKSTAVIEGNGHLVRDTYLKPDFFYINVMTPFKKSVKQPLTKAEALKFPVQTDVVDLSLHQRTVFRAVINATDDKPDGAFLGDPCRKHDRIGSGEFVEVIAAR